MEKLAEVLVAFLDVVKADLAQSKKGVFDVGVSLGLTCAAGIFLVAAVVLVSYALYLGLMNYLDKTSAVFFTGLFYVLCGGVSIWYAHRKIRA